MLGRKNYDPRLFTRQIRGVVFSEGETAQVRSRVINAGRLDQIGRATNLSLERRSNIAAGLEQRLESQADI